MRHVAENRDQEAAPKAAACADLPLTWHFVGQLQTNKARSVAGYADVVHSVDRSRLVTALSAAPRCVTAVELDCLVQVALDAESGDVGRPRGGAAPDAVDELADAVAAAQGLRLAGVMTVAPLAGPYAGRPGSGLRAAAGNLNRPADKASCCNDGVSRDECGSRRGGGGRCDTCARRQRGTRSPTPARVTSPRKSDHSRKYGHFRWETTGGSGRVDPSHR